VQRKTIQILSFALFLGLLLWGGFTLLYYLGVGVHVSVLFPGWDSWLAICAEKNYVCRGAMGFWPFVYQSIARLSPLLVYTFLSILVYGLYVGAQWFAREEIPKRFVLKPWHFIAVFVLSLWLLFTSFSFGSADGQPIKRMYEPGPQVYQGISEETLAALTINFQELQSRGCLRQVGTTEQGVAAFDVTATCMQQAFITRVLSQVLFILFILFDLLVLGATLLGLLRLKPVSLLIDATLSIAIGATALIVLLWIAAVAGVYTSTVGWALLLLLPVVCYQASLSWLRRLTRETVEMDVGMGHVMVFLFWLLLTYLAFNFLTVVRPFPIGWDDLGSYVNRPHLLVSYGKFIPSMASFQWEYLTSLGFLLFGYDSIFGATASMLMNWLAGLVAVLSILIFCQYFLGKKQGILAALFYYVLPLVGHFSFADMKIDNAVFAMGALSIFALFCYLFPRSEDDVPEQEHLREWRWLFVAGIFAASAFAMKVTAVMVLMTVGAMLAGVILSGWGFAGAVLLSFFIFSYQGLNVNEVLQKIGASFVNVQTVQLLLLILGVLFFGYALYQARARLRSIFGAIGILLGSFFLLSFPWLFHNTLLYGDMPPKLRLTAPNTISAQIDLSATSVPADMKSPYRILPPELKIDLELPACKAGSFDPELDRYWGFNDGISHYLTLPFRSVMNLDMGGYYVTTLPALLLLPLLFLLPYVWTPRGRWLKWLGMGTFFLILQWVLLANGVPWYGIGMFLGLVIALEAFISKAPDAVSRTIAIFLIGFSLLIGIAMRMWQFEMQQNLLEYPLGKISAETLRERTIPHYDNIRETVMERFETMKDRPYLLRIGTFIPYFIPKSLEVIPVADNQLGLFNCLYAERDAAKTLERLKVLGFNSIVFDTNTSTIEADEEGPLHEKVNAFVEFVNTPGLGLEVPVNDPNAGVAYVVLP